MPRQKDFKRLVRARMQKTGEAYTTARAQILKHNPIKKAAPPAAAPASYAKLAGMSDAAVKAKTGCAWDKWVKSLDHHGAAELQHGEIAAMIHDTWKLDDWWSQMVAVGYERIKGLRERGQRRSGHYDASKSKTFNVSAATLFEALTAQSALARWLPEAAKVRTTKPKRSVRLEMQDGAIAAFWLTEKGKNKVALSVQQERLADKNTQLRVKAFWGEKLAALAGEVQ